MSATGRGAQRKTNDLYETPEWLTQAILPHLYLSPAVTVYEPACGKGAIVDVLIKSGVAPYNIFCSDVDAKSVMHVNAAFGVHSTQCDFLQQSFPFQQSAYLRPSLIITNPPYLVAEAFIQQALATIAPWGTVAMLLRLNFLGGQKRAPFLRQNPCDVYVSPRRPSFTGGGTDATEYAWFVWRPSKTNRIFILPTEQA